MRTRCVLLSGIALAVFAVAAASAAPVSGGAVEVKIIAATHHPKVNVGWPLKVVVSTPAGKPLAATLTMEVIAFGAVVGKIDNGKVYHFVGTWQERRGNLITWPAQAKGEPLTLLVIVKAAGKTVRKSWAIHVVG